MNMQHSFQTSFVPGNNNDNAPTRPRSLHRRTATLATHPFYAPEDIPAHGYYPQQPLLAPGRPVMGEYGHGVDFQSNVWLPPTSGSTQLWNRFIPGRRPLAGLGITFGPPEVPASAPYLLASPPTLAPFLRSAAPSPQVVPAGSRDNPPRAPGPVPAGRVYRDAHTAYSDCPSADFVAHSPALVRVIPYSPADDFLMLADSPALAESSGIKRKREESGPQVDISMLSMDSPQGPVIGLFADINYRIPAHNTPDAGVNPGELSGDGPGLSVLSSRIEADEVEMLINEPEPVLSPPSHAMDDSPQLQADFPEDALSAIVSVLAESVKQEQAVSHSVPVSTATHIAPRYPPGLPMQPPAYASRTLAGSSMTFSASIGQPFLTSSRSPLAPVQPRNLADQSPGPIQRPTPILNAHEGVPLETLRTNADSFRRLNPGCELDKTFLQMFAGRLSQHGDLLPEFRCYVKGCSQTNKRRDHIIVHVGSHVEHRPFQCDECGMRFLRKNECKRHMSSHVGVKPFTCPICAPYQDKSFVRQDLLKRHMKVTHSTSSYQWPDGRRKRAKLEEPVSPRVEEDFMSLDQ